MEVQLMDLKEQVDASLGAESMVTQLASLKLELEDRVKLLEDEVNELEALEQIQEQLIESNQELETDLREEIDKLGGQVKILEQHKNRNTQSSKEPALAKTSGKFLASQQLPLQLPKVSCGNSIEYI